MRGYWNWPEDTAQAFAPSGWLRTGDIGTMEAIGMADAASGEAMRLLVVRSDPGLDAGAVSARCRARLTAYIWWSSSARRCRRRRSARC
jgi:long-chain acyl-CoA synthetase